MTLDRARVAADFRRLVNLDAAELAAWLETEESRRVGQMQADGQSIGHAAGRRTVGILATPEDALTDDDYRHMRRTVGFIRRLGAQEPANTVTSRWRYSLMNWGHDPLRS